MPSSKLSMALVPSSLLLFLVSSSVWVALSSQPLPSPDGQGREHCQPVLCGSVNISYPFGLIPERAEQANCSGGPPFQLRCLDNITYFGLFQSEFNIRILSIFNHNRSFLVAGTHLRRPYFDSSSPSGCRIPTADDEIVSQLVPPFSASPVNQNLTLYNCNKPPPLGVGLVETVCGNNTFVRAADGRYDASGNYSLEGCTAATVPVFGGVSGKVDASNYQQLVWDGYLATWQWPPPGDNGNGRKTILIVSVAVAASLLLPCIYVFVWHRQKLSFFLCKKTSGTIEENIEALILAHASLAPKRYKYSEVTKITSSLNNKLGEGGYGIVFKGRLDDGRLVAVKFLHDSKSDGEEFVNEVMSIGSTSHINIVSLFGFCLEGSKRALIYEYMPNGSLDKYIYSDNPKKKFRMG